MSEQETNKEQIAFEEKRMAEILRQIYPDFNNDFSQEQKNQAIEERKRQNEIIEKVRQIRAEILGIQGDNIDLDGYDMLEKFIRNLPAEVGIKPEAESADQGIFLDKKRELNDLEKCEIFHWIKGSTPPFYVDRFDLPDGLIELKFEELYKQYQQRKKD